MPLYDYRCKQCGETTEHVVPSEESETPLDCPLCGAKSATYFQMPAPALQTERIVGDKKLIWDERQVSSEKGDRWRDEGTTGKAGGAGKKLYFSN
jgi:putative FmdB family regulatory protein